MAARALIAAAALITLGWALAVAPRFPELASAAGATACAALLYLARSGDRQG